MKTVLNAVLMTTIVAFSVSAQDKKIEVNAPAKTNAPGLALTQTNAILKPTKDQISYAIGMNIGSNIKRQGVDVDADSIAKGIKDTLAGSPRVTEQEAQQTLMAMQTELRAKREEEGKVQGEKNKKEGAAFLAENAKKSGVITTTNGLQYKIITTGKGERPKSSDTVTTQYRGRLINGTEFDSSYKRGQPAEFPVTGVIKGWTEALQIMPVGSKWELYIPANLAYGERGSPPTIGPDAALIFEIELIAIKTPTESSQAVSGEIIKVPSADELKKGAKIEVIRPDQTNTFKAGSTNPATPKK